MKKLLVLACLLFAGTAHAASATPQQIAFAEEYLNNLKTIASEFIQEAPSGDISTGTFYLSRPGKLRWQYNPPVPILIVVNKGSVAYYDAELDEVTYLSAESENKALRITFALKEKPDEGSMTLVFEEAPFLLRKIEIADAAKNITKINLNNPQMGVAIEDKLFTFKNPRYNKKR